MLSINEPRTGNRFALFNLGFRPFFLGAAVFAVASMLYWMAIYLHGASPRPVLVAAQSWHGHEMIYGYALAVIAGFLLTAIRNWTGQPTLHGFSLFALFTCWLTARVLPVLGVAIEVVAIIDCLFLGLLVLSTAWPIIKVRQWHNLGIISKIVLLWLSNMLFYAGVLGFLEQGVRWGLYSGLYLVLALLFVMGRRVIPFFIEKGVGYPVQVKNYLWLDRSSLLVFLLFWIVDVFAYHALAVSLLAAVLVLLHVTRLTGWYTHGIWQRPLIWVLYLAYAMIVLGFVLKATVPLGINPFLAVHAFAVGGIGLMTAGMMARVSLGHSGRSVAEPPRSMTVIFVLLCAAALARVVMPLLLPVYSTWWITAALWLWVAAFSWLFLVGLPIWWRPRIDGQPG